MFIWNSLFVDERLKRLEEAVVEQRGWLRPIKGGPKGAFPPERMKQAERWYTDLPELGVTWDNEDDDSHWQEFVGRMCDQINLPKKED